MTIKDANTRLIITLPKDVKFQLEELATKDDRSLSNLINVILKQYLESHND